MPWWNAGYYKISPGHSPRSAYLGESWVVSRPLSLRGVVSTRNLSIGRIVAASTRHPLIVLFLVGSLALAALVFTAQNFAMTADTSQLISKRLDWRQRGIAFEAAFPQFNNLTMVVVDGATPELADDAAKRLAAALQERQDLFQTVRWPDGGPFFEREGLLFLPSADVEAATSGLIRAAPLLARLTADPSLRGALVVLTDILQGLKHGDVSLQDIQPTMTAFSKTFEDAAAGRPAFFSWRTFFIGEKSPDLREIRHVLLVQPVMDYAALEPGAAASDAIRNIAQSLGLDQAHGVTVRLTGAVPLADEEFASLAQDAHLVLGAMLAALFGILWLAVRSVRVVLAISVTTLIGLVLTAAAGLLVVGRFNLLSMAFIPLFVGLGVDFSIQFSVRALAKRLVQPSREAALAETGASIGRPLALSAAAIGAGFFAFLPTSYIGVAELGAIAGLGMIVAFCSQHRAPAGAPGPAAVPAGAEGGGRNHHAGPRRSFRDPASFRRADIGARCGHRIDRAVAAGALRLRSAEPQESHGGIDDHPAGARGRPRPDALRDQRSRAVTCGSAGAGAASPRATRGFPRRHPAELAADPADGEARGCCRRCGCHRTGYRECLPSPRSLRRGTPEEAGRAPRRHCRAPSSKPERNRHRSRCCGWRRHWLS